jgi:hypothetical protein
VFTGSSRVCLGVDGQTVMHNLERDCVVFNYGIPGAGLFVQDVYLRRLRSLGIKPDIVFVEIMPAYLDERLPDQYGDNVVGFCADEVSRLPATLQSLRGPVRKWALSRLLSATPIRTEVCGAISFNPECGEDAVHRDLRALDKSGWLAVDHPPQDRPRLKEIAHRQLDGSYRGFHLSDERERQLAAIIKAGQKDGAQVVLLLCPEGSEFRQLYSPEMHKEISNLLARLKERFGVPVVDARDWMADDYFFDMHHLRPDGARLFSARLAREALAPQLEARTKPIDIRSRPSIPLAATSYSPVHFLAIPATPGSSP